VRLRYSAEKRSGECGTRLVKIDKIIPLSAPRLLCNVTFQHYLQRSGGYFLSLESDLALLLTLGKEYSGNAFVTPPNPALHSSTVPGWIPSEQLRLFATRNTGQLPYFTQ
jgi:hypothetical protein